MKHWFCPGCKKRCETKNFILIRFCGCGYFMEKIKEGKDGTRK